MTGLAGAVTGADFRAGRRRTFVVAFCLALAALLGPGTVGLEWASAQDPGPEREAFAATDVGAALVRHVWQGYKSGEAWPGRNFQGLDFLEPLVPRVAVARGDVGRIVVNSALPYALLTSAFAAESTDQSTYNEIKRWGWVGVDQGQDNQPLLIGLLGLAGASIFLPAHEDASGYSWALRADRATVFALGVGISAAETAMLKPVFDRKRPTGNDDGSRPSGHATAAFAAMAFLSNILRDTLRPHDEPDLGMRVLKEVTCVVPYLGAAYMALERVHGGDHFLTDTLLGGALGVFTTNMFYAWSFLRREQGRGWLDHVSASYDPRRRGIAVTIGGRF